MDQCVIISLEICIEEQRLESYDIMRMNVMRGSMRSAILTCQPGLWHAGGLDERQMFWLVKEMSSRRVDVLGVGTL